MALPIDPRDLIRSGSQIQEEREKPVRIALFIDIDAPDQLVSAIQERFRPFTANALLHIEVAEPDTKLLVDPSADAVIAVVGSGGQALADSLAGARERAVPAAAIALAADAMEIADRLGHPYRDTFADTDLEHLVDYDLGEWLVDRLSSKSLALAHNFEFMRRAVAMERVKSTAVQNALIGAIAFMPGTDMPLMTANQSKMILQIAAAYGEQLGAQRMRELAGVVGGAFVLRTIARQTVAFLPGFGWAIKGGIGYAGTVAMGYAAIRYFENDTELRELKDRLDAYGRQVSSRLRSMSRRELTETRKQLDSDVPVLASAGESATGDK